MEHAIHQASLKLGRQLLDGWRKRVDQHRPPGSGTSSHSGAPVHAFMLLDSWEGNALADALLAAHPELAEERCAVPDPHFKNREDHAPCLVPLPEALAPASPADSLAAEAAGEHLAQWLTLARQQAQQRQASQHLGAIVFSDLGAEDIVAHWVDLGHQQAPGGTGARLFRYQDPRVMQRVWPLLSPRQRQQWLGPVQQWWALTQPWGPWEPAQFGATELDATGEPAEWFRAETPAPAALQDDATQVPLRALFDTAQWQAAHITPAANRTWARYAADQLPMRDQPDAETVCRLLADGQRLGLQGPNLQDYVWCTWRPNAPAGASRELPWQSERGAALLAHLLKTLRQQPESRFASLFADAMSRK